MAPKIVTRTEFSISMPDDDTRTITKIVRLPGQFAPLGECPTCDQYWREGTDFFPPHRISTRCSYPDANRRPHCTCDACF